MELTGLTKKELLGLVALMEDVAMANGAVTDGERVRIDRIAEMLGDEEYRELLEEADERFTLFNFGYETGSFFAEISECNCFHNAPP